MEGYVNLRKNIISHQIITNHLNNISTILLDNIYIIVHFPHNLV